MAIFLSFYFSLQSAVAGNDGSLDLVQMCLFVMSFLPLKKTAYVFPLRLAFTCCCCCFSCQAESDDNAWIIVSTVWFMANTTVCSSSDFSIKYVCAQQYSTAEKMLTFVCWISPLIQQRLRERERESTHSFQSTWECWMSFNVPCNSVHSRMKKFENANLESCFKVIVTLEQHMPRVLFSIQSQSHLAFKLASIA